jgi:hypothetical protein
MLVQQLCHFEVVMKKCPVETLGVEFMRGRKQPSHNLQVVTAHSLLAGSLVALEAVLIVQPLQNCQTTSYGRRNAEFPIDDHLPALVKPLQNCKLPRLSGTLTGIFGYLYARFVSRPHQDVNVPGRGRRNDSRALVQDATGAKPAKHLHVAMRASPSRDRRAGFLARRAERALQ